MTLTVRLDPQLERKFDLYCRKHRVTKSAVVSSLVERHVAQDNGARPSAYDLAEKAGLIGAFSSGKGDLARNHKKYLLDRLRAKHSR